MPPIIGIVEDQILFGELLKKLCITEFSAKVAFNVRTGAAALRQVNDAQLDLLILDIGLPDIDGVALAKQLLSRSTRPRILVITAFDTPVTIRKLHLLPIAGFLEKRYATLTELKRAIDSAIRGQTHFSPGYQATQMRMMRDTSSFDRILSPYEQQILAEIGAGKNDDELSHIFHISPATAQSRRRDIMRKLEIHTTPKLMQYAIAMGFTLFSN